MMTAADTLEKARPLLFAAVVKAEQVLGSRMAAYELISSRVGKSARWVRKLLGREEVTVEFHDFINIAAAYRSLCARIEAQAEFEQQRANALREELDAVLASAAVVVEGVAGTPTARGARGEDEEA